MAEKEKTHTRLIVVLAMLVAFAPLSIDMYLPALPKIASSLQTPDAYIQGTISVFLAGFSAGMLLYGPLSDRYGRRRILLWGILLYMLASVGCSLAQSGTQLVLWRLAQALGGAAASVLARAIVRDVFGLAQAASVLSWMHLITMVATLIAPLSGSLLLEMGNWRSIFGALTAAGGMAFVSVCMVVPETLPPSLRARSVGAAFQAYGGVLVNTRAMGFIFSMGFSFAGMFAFLTASPFVYIDHFGVSPKQYAWLFCLNVFGIMGMTYLNTRMLKTQGARRLLALGSRVALVSGLGLGASALTGMGGLTAIVCCVLAYISVTGMMGANAIANLLALFPRQAGAAAGLAVSMQFGLGTLLSAFAAFFHTDGPQSMGVVVGAAGLLCFAATHMALHPFARGGK